MLGEVTTVAGKGSGNEQHNLAAGEADGYKDAAKFDCPQGITLFSFVFTAVFFNFPIFCVHRFCTFRVLFNLWFN
jgi:hypothetical protein